MLHVISNSYLKLSVSELGAEMHSVFDLRLNRELLWQANPSVWARHAPVLFPIVGKLKNDCYNYNNKTFELSQHGFARDKKFNLLHKNADSLSFELTHDNDTLVKYPFAFKLIITYIINESTLICKYEVVNINESEMYFSIGAHPGFICPIDKSEKFSDYFIETDKTQLLRYHIDGGLQNGETEALTSNGCISINKELFAKDAIILKEKNLNGLSLVSKKYKLRFEWNNMPYFGIWTKPGNESFICLEPWAGIADSANANGNLRDKEGIICLEKDKKFLCGFSFEALSLA